MKPPGISSNHYDLETGDEYWVSGVKKNGQDRHWSGSGRIYIDKKSIEGYLKEIDADNLDTSKFDIIEFEKTDKTKFIAIENESIQHDDNSFLDKRLVDMNEEELRKTIDYYYEIEQNLEFQKDKVKKGRFIHIIVC